MNSWICPVKVKSWRIIKKKGVFGGAKKSLKVFEDLQIGDTLFFHVFRTKNGIAGKGRVMSKLFVDNQNIWGKDMYPYRVKVEILNDLLAEKKQPIPISCLFDNVIDQEITIEPYLRNLSIVRISENQASLLSKLLDEEANLCKPCK
jgi:hypothetical protein